MFFMSCMLHLSTPHPNLIFFRGWLTFCVVHTCHAKVSFPFFHRPKKCKTHHFLYSRKCVCFLHSVESFRIYMWGLQVWCLYFFMQKKKVFQSFRSKKILKLFRRLDDVCIFPVIPNTMCLDIKYDATTGHYYFILTSKCWKMLFPPS